MATEIGQEVPGAVVYQVTDDPGMKSNIYCEIPFCCSDSRRFVFQRERGEDAPNDMEYVLCEFGDWKMQVIGRGVPRPTITPEGVFYFRRRTEDGGEELVRVNLRAGESEVIFKFSQGLEPLGLPTMSPGERYLAYGVTIGYDPQMFGIEVADLRSGRREIINKDPYICNPHTQFEPSKGKRVMVQHNRGCAFKPDGTRTRLVGEEGATEYLLEIPGGEVTRLRFGPPHTTSSTGHESWIGDTEEFLVSVHAVGDFAPEKGNLLAVRAGAQHRVISRGHPFVHVGTSVCGRFFTSDARPEGKVIVGSIATGKNVVVCSARTSYRFGQNSHPHPYLSPDLKWVVFNSDRTGRPQIYAARIPAEVIQGLEK